jgi:hypothetical protein
MNRTGGTRRPHGCSNEVREVDAVLAINAAAPAAHNRDFSRVRLLRIVS